MKKIYISIEDLEEKKQILKIIKELHLDKSIINEKKYNNKSYKIVICNDRPSEIKQYYDAKKILIISRKTGQKRKRYNPIYYSKNVYTYTKDNELREILYYQNHQSKINKSIIKALLFLQILGLTLGIIILCNQNNLNSKKDTPKDNKITKLEKKDYKDENIVFYGDSITDFYDLEKYYPNLPVVNSGTSGFKATDLLDLIEERVYIYNPTKVFILIGTNDIAYSDVTNEELVKQIEKISKKIKANRPHAKIYIESIYPVNNHLSSGKSYGSPRDNLRINKINRLIKKMCENNKIEYINMHKILVDSDGTLIEAYTVDGLHLSDEGYRVITKKIMEYLK